MEYKPAYKNLTVWQNANQLVVDVYKITKSFPKEEIFGLVSQMRRCAVSVPANIVEGYGRRTDKDKIHFYYITRGSLNEIEYYLSLSKELGYITDSDYKNLEGVRSTVGKLLTGFIKHTSR